MKKSIKIEWKKTTKNGNFQYRLRITDQSHRQHEFGQPEGNAEFICSNGLSLVSNSCPEVRIGRIKSDGILFMRGYDGRDLEWLDVSEDELKFIIEGINEYNGHFNSPEIFFSLETGEIGKLLKLPKSMFEI